MTDTNDDIKLVFDALEHTPMGHRMGKFSVSVICPICNEGGKRHSHSHCYVGLIDGGPPVVYHCWISECSGVVTPTFLHDVGIFDNELDTILNIFNRSFRNLSKASMQIQRIKKKQSQLKVPEFTKSSNNQEKLEYMQHRLHVKFTMDILHELKVIPSLYEFLNYNGLEPNPRFRKVNNTIDRDYVGFLSTTNDWIVFRNIRKNDNLRYIKYDLFGSKDTSQIIYTVPGTSCDLFSDNVNLNVVEGTFDALGVFCHVKKFDRINNIYAACCGSGYLNTIRYFIKMGFIGNLNVNIYSDSDKPYKYYKDSRVFDELEPWVKSINVFYNSKSKDYGVPRNDIEIIQYVNGR